MADLQAPVMQKPAPSTGASVSHISRLVYPPIVHVIWGLLLIGVFVIGSMLQVQTSEAWMLNASDPGVWIPNMNLFSQFPQFWNGHMDAHHAIAFIFAWGVQVVLITCKIGTMRVQAHVMKKWGGSTSVHPEMVANAKHRGWGWDILSGLLILFNSIVDCIYAWSLGPIQAIVFMLVLFLNNFYAGTHGIQNVAGGIAEMRKSN